MHVHVLSHSLMKNIEFLNKIYFELTCREISRLTRRILMRLQNDFILPRGSFTLSKYSTERHFNLIYNKQIFSWSNNKKEFLKTILFAKPFKPLCLLNLIMFFPVFCLFHLFECLFIFSFPSGFRNCFASVECWFIYLLEALPRVPCLWGLKSTDYITCRGLWAQSQCVCMAIQVYAHQCLPVDLNINPNNIYQ